MLVAMVIGREEQQRCSLRDIETAGEWVVNGKKERIAQYRGAATGHEFSCLDARQDANGSDDVLGWCCLDLWQWSGGAFGIWMHPALGCHSLYRII